MPGSLPPCCHHPDAEHLADLPHVRQFDLDLYRCRRCSAYWVYAWRAGQGGWEAASAQDADTMRRLDGDALRAFVKGWATAFS
jgi:hypothetical protein